MLTLWEVSQELSKRLSNIFLKDAEAIARGLWKRPKFQADEHGAIMFYFTNIFTATRAADSARAIKQDGRV